ncbi:MAG: asparagine synthase (glutamine-hydrolyzing), partial [Flavobacteriales bacterium]|nr:asparagine synthase (glutamine-hydrolyzing) [Flavobacteriales bacterium]
MCGISGIYGLEGLSNPKELVTKMTQKLAHRGPDAEGFFINEHLALGHRRLSIIDTSADGNQPLHSHNGRLSLVFNGELYNYLELKAELKDYPFKTKSDTEVVLAAFETWGDQALQRFNGMFAFALWDDEKKVLKLVRDRLGIKPLYVASVGHHFLFASEVRSILASDLVERKLSQDGLIDYLRYQTVHGQNTIIQGIKQIPPGSMLVIKEEEQFIDTYWSLSETANMEAGRHSRDEQKKNIRSLLSSSVQYRMRADVPFGAFLSGGIDSSAIVGLMSEVSSQPISTFNISFKENEFSEAPYARMIAKKFNT